MPEAQDHAAEEFREIPEEPPPSLDQIQALRPVPEGLGDDVQNLLTGGINGFFSGFPRLDALTRGIREVTILAGAPGVGKSSLALGIALNVSHLGKPVVYCSLEMPRLEIIRRSLLAVAPAPARSWEQLIASPDLVRRAQERLSEHSRLLRVIDSTTRVKLHDWERLVIGLAAAHDQNPPLIVIDHARLMYIEPSHYRDELGRQEVLLAELMCLTQRTGACVLLVHELNKAGMKGMSLEGVKGTVSAVYNAAIVMGLVDPQNSEEESRELPEFKDDVAPNTQAKSLRLVIRKNRYGPSNYWVPFVFEPTLFRMSEGGDEPITLGRGSSTR